MKSKSKSLRAPGSGAYRTLLQSLKPDKIIHLALIYCVSYWLIAIKEPKMF